MAKRGDVWLHMFGALKWIAITWALIILYKRIKNRLRQQAYLTKGITLYLNDERTSEKYKY